MQKTALLYLHGLGSSGQSDTGQFLQRHFATDTILACPSYRPQFFHESVERIDHWLEELRQQTSCIAVLASSMGGWHGLHALARHPDIHLLALNPVLAPASLRSTPRADDVDQRTGQTLEWPEIIADNFPPAPADALDSDRLRLLIGAQDDVVPPQPTLDTASRLNWSIREFADWGHRAELDETFLAELNILVRRAQNGDTSRG